MNGNIKWSRAGRAALKQSQANVVKYLLGREPEIRRAKGHRAVGAGQGFRQAASLASKDKMQSLRNGDDAVRLRALIQNGCHPAHRNGN